MVAIVLIFRLISGLAGMIDSAISSSSARSARNASLKTEQGAIVAEGKSIEADMESANRNGDWNRVGEIMAHKADWERRGNAFSKRATEAGWRPK